MYHQPSSSEIFITPKSLQELSQNLNFWYFWDLSGTTMNTGWYDHWKWLEFSIVLDFSSNFIDIWVILPSIGLTNLESVCQPSKTIPWPPRPSNTNIHA